MAYNGLTDRGIPSINDERQRYWVTIGIQRIA